jgi:hypothetical protein
MRHGCLHDEQRCMHRVGQNHVYRRCILIRCISIQCLLMRRIPKQYLLQGFHQKCGHIQCIYAGLANPLYASCRLLRR